MCGEKCINATMVAMTILIFLNSAFYLVYYFFMDKNLSIKWINIVLAVSSALFILVDCGVLLFSVVRVNSMLKTMDDAKINLPYLILHVGMMVVMTGIQGVYFV